MTLVSIDFDKEILIFGIRYAPRPAPVPPVPAGTAGKLLLTLVHGLLISIMFLSKGV